ncbi:MAG: aspartate--tRNA ligase [Actinobacteria bacterium]|nr:aspartate--tRNA ligase [Actinomycetota bacterium]
MNTPSHFAGAPRGLRSDWCGDLRIDDVGRTVSVTGWVARRREHGEHLAFVDLRDRSGIIQCVVDGAHEVRTEYVLRITGTVRERPDGTRNTELETGAVEIVDCDVEVLNTAEPLPFPIDDRRDVDETLRLRHRYVDLRRARLQRNLVGRARINAAIRGAMDRQGFVEVETPMLIASTPEGARDFVVPSRLSPGSFYALPQSPQLFKQLAMVGGVDRYYQIARCMRDEDLRADRQFEFSQLDLEASFVGQAEILDFVTEAVSDAVATISGDRPVTFETMTWYDAQERFGSDKPDVRFGVELTELTEVFASTDFNAFKAPCVKGIRVPGGAELTRNRLDALTDRAKKLGAKGLVWAKVDGPTAITSPIAKFLTDREVADTVEMLGAESGDLILIVADDRPMVRRVLGALRLDLGRPGVGDGGLRFVWVTEFPLFEGLDESGNPIPAHHPFTMPHPDDIGLLDATGDELTSIRSQAYDLVLNGWELGSGSVRIHRRDTQQRIFGLLGIGADEAQEKFGFLLDAFRFGAPPHAGFAFGIDRLTALLLGEENIREVIAYPKTQSGADPLTGAPSPIEAGQLTELGLRVVVPQPR